MTAAIRAGGERITFDVRVIPRAARTEVGAKRGGALLVRVTAAPVEGAANEAVVDALAEALGVRRSEIRIERGERGRLKSVSAPAAARARVEALAAAGARA